MRPPADIGAVARARSVRTALTIAGSDPSGGAGAQMDLKCFAALGVHGCSALTAVTVQNTAGVRSANPLAPRLVKEQLDALYDDFKIDAVKTGMLHDAAIVKVVAGRLAREGTPLVVDPVLSATSGAALARPDLAKAIRTRLMPLAILVAPNVPEAEALSGVRISGLETMKRACVRLSRSGARNVLIKGGHLGGGSASDLLYDGEFHIFRGQRIYRDVHGTGCMLSAFTTGFLACGLPVPEAVGLAKLRVMEAIRFSERPGRGRFIGDPLVCRWNTSVRRRAIRKNTSQTL